MKTIEKYNSAFAHFKQSYKYKMGGTQTVVLPNGKEKNFDDREYYSGRGARYNSSIKHDEIGIVKVSRKEYSDFLKKLREREVAIQARVKQDEERQLRIENAKAKGIYSLEDSEYGGRFVELTYSEMETCQFDTCRLANTLNVSVKDVELLHSTGKTYVFARQKESGKLIRLYHPSLDCNRLSIHVEFVTEEYFNEFNHDEWASAPFAKLLGQTESKNHFVC